MRASVAHIVAQLVARRSTRPEEVPALMRSVEDALAALAEPPPAPETAPPSHETPPPRAPRARRTRAPAELPEIEAPAPAPQPRLLRRAEVVTAPPRDEAEAPRAAPSGVLRGVVKWFDQRTRRGALRLQGCSGDVAVEPAFLDEMAISRLYKGQEVEATLSAEAAPRLMRLVVSGGGWQVQPTGGIVRNRQSKPVVVELKRETMRRAAARAEAENLLGPTRER
ncbi:MAG TPA: hypothetical protein VN802_00315 [Stellaceae bacterium]|nr:hypothetical protein [Stellaceae bacterium]